MRAHNVLIISSGCSKEANSETLDGLVRAITAMNRNPILVLGPDGDEIISGSQEIEKCDLVFDPNYAGQFFSSLKAGLQATHGAAFVVPLSASLPPPSIWQALEKDLLLEPTASQCDVIRPTLNADAAGHSCGPSAWPLLITPRGVKSLVAMPAATDWEQCEKITVREARLPETKILT
jgi:hypothetical protein